MVHHPAGDLKKVSLDVDPPATAYFGAACTQGGGEGGGEGGGGGGGEGACYGHADWKVVEYDEGSSEGGSSGAPLLDQEALVVGQVRATLVPP